MKITRMLDNEEIEIELMPHEMTKAYYEQEALFMEKECAECISELYKEEVEKNKELAEELLSETIRLYKKYREFDEDQSSNLTSATMDAYREIQKSLSLK